MSLDCKGNAPNLLRHVNSLFDALGAHRTFATHHWDPPPPPGLTSPTLLRKVAQKLALTFSWRDPPLATVSRAPRARLLPSKLFVPVLDSDVLVRERLLRELAAAQAARLILVSAPAGSGKTTLVADWMRRVDAPVGWVSLDPDDDDPHRFMEYLVEASRSFAPDAAGRAIALLRSTPPPEPTTVVRALLGELATTAPRNGCRGLIVLDDYHLVAEEEIHEAVSLLTERAVGIKLVLVSRSDPPLPLARLRARRQLFEVREADLRFRSTEAARFVETICRRSLSRESLEALAQRTEGWAAGLQLAALALRSVDDPDTFVADFHGTHAFVADFLADEVLAGIPPERQDFLLRTALLDRLTGPLCDAALDRSDSQTLLEELSRANLFLLPLDGERRWFRYHQLFRDLLQRRSDQVPERERRALLLRASEWSADDGMADHAVAYAIRAGEQARAADLVARSGLAALAAGEAHTALRWIRTLPEATVESSADHCVIAAWASSLDEGYDAVRAYGRRALELAAAGPGEWPYVPQVELHARTIVAGIEFTEGGSAKSTLAALGSVLEETDPEDLLLRSSAEIMTGKTLCHAGRYADSLAHHDRALELGIRAGSDLLRLAAITGRGKTLLLRGRVRQTLAVLEEELARRVELREVLQSQTANLYAMIAVCYLQRAQLGAAEAALREAWSVMGADPDDDDAWRVMLRFGRSRTTPFHSMAPLAYHGLTAHIGTLVASGRQDLAGEHLDVVESLVRAPVTPGERAVVDALLVLRWAAAGEAVRLRQWVRREARPAGTGTAYWDRVALATHARAALGAGDADTALARLGELIDPADPAREIDLVSAEALALAATAASILGCNAEEARFADAALRLSAPDGRTGVWTGPGGDVAAILERALTRATVPPEVLSFASDTLALLRERTRKDGPTEVLSDRELAVLRLIAAGHSNEEIGRALYIAVGTVKKHTHNIYRKLGVRRRTAAVREAREQGLLAAEQE